MGIEIGGSKLQVGIGSGEGPPLVILKRLAVRPDRGAAWIRSQLAELVLPLLAEHRVRAVGVGFGGPVDPQSGCSITSHQVSGWDQFPLKQWCEQTFGLPAVVANDSDTAGVAEARFGAGRGHRVIFYTNVGSGIGGALVIDGQPYCGSSGVASEIGHLRPGLDAEDSQQTVESLASGWAISAWVRRQLADADVDLRKAEPSDHPTEGGSAADRRDLLARCDHQPALLDTRLIAEAARDGNRLAQAALDRACRAFGWAVAQAVTLLAPNVVVVGGGVSLVGEQFWLQPLRRYVRRYVFPPLADRFQLVAAALGQEVVVHGALALARDRCCGG